MQEYWQTSILDTWIEVKKLPLRHIQNSGSGWQADIHNSTLGLHRLMYNCCKSASESSSFAKRGSPKIGVLGISGKVCTAFVQ
jgi:hypothetical protein